MTRHQFFPACPPFVNTVYCSTVNNFHATRSPIRDQSAPMNGDQPEPSGSAYALPILMQILGQVSVRRPAHTLSLHSSLLCLLIYVQVCTQQQKLRKIEKSQFLLKLLNSSGTGGTRVPSKNCDFCNFSGKNCEKLEKSQFLLLRANLDISVLIGCTSCYIKSQQHKQPAHAGSVQTSSHRATPPSS